MNDKWFYAKCKVGKTFGFYYDDANVFMRQFKVEGKFYYAFSDNCIKNDCPVHIVTEDYAIENFTTQGDIPTGKSLVLKTGRVITMVDFINNFPRIYQKGLDPVKNLEERLNKAKKIQWGYSHIT